MKFFQSHPKIKVALLVYNRKEAGAKLRAEKFQVTALYIKGEEFKNEEGPLNQAFLDFEIDFILLAGFLLMIPFWVIQKYPDKILNIHPALLPNFGGKGMYGHFVHSAVKKSGIKETGMTIHLVNEKYDEGKILFQATCPVWESDSESDIAARVLNLEHLHYPLVAEQFILSKP